MDQEHVDRLASLYEETFKRLYSVAYRLMGSEELAEEVVHDVFVLALIHREEFMTHPVPEAWLMIS